MLTSSQSQPASQSFAVPAELSQLALIRTIVRDICEAAGLAGDGNGDARRILAELELGVTELVSNVIRHGHENVPGGNLRFRMWTSHTTFELELIHDGRSFDGNTADITEITDPQEGGMGLYLISQCVDQINYSTTTNGSSRIHLTRTFPTS